MTLKLILAFVIAFAVSAVVGFFLVPYLKRIKAGQSIKENGPTDRKSTRLNSSHTLAARMPSSA